MSQEMVLSTWSVRNTSLTVWRNRKIQYSSAEKKLTIGERPKRNGESWIRIRGERGLVEMLRLLRRPVKENNAKGKKTAPLQMVFCFSLLDKLTLRKFDP